LFVAARRQNASYNANSMLLSMSNTNPNCSSATQSRFHSTGRRVRKQLQGRCSWRCAALLLICLAATLLAIVSYLIGKYRAYTTCTFRCCLWTTELNYRIMRCHVLPRNSCRSSLMALAPHPPPYMGLLINP